MKRPFLLGYNVLTKKKTEGLEGIKEMRRYNIMLFKSKKKAEKKTEKRTGENRQDSRRAVCQGERGINWRTAPPFLCRESPLINGSLPKHNRAGGIDKCTSYQFPLITP